MNKEEIQYLNRLWNDCSQKMETLSNTLYVVFVGEKPLVDMSIEEVENSSMKVCNKIVPFAYIDGEDIYLHNMSSLVCHAVQSLLEEGELTIESDCFVREDEYIKRFPTEVEAYQSLEQELYDWQLLFVEQSLPKYEIVPNWEVRRNRLYLDTSYLFVAEADTEKMMNFE